MTSLHCKIFFYGITAALFCTPVISHGLEDNDTQSIILPSGVSPKEIFGNPCVIRAGNNLISPILSCKVAQPTQKPAISVSVIDSRCERNEEQILAAHRRQFDDNSPFFNVIREVTFTPKSVPDSIGIHAFYQTSFGNRYVWTVCGQGKLTRVLVIILAQTDNEALKAEIEEKVFGISRVGTNRTEDSVNE